MSARQRPDGVTLARIAPVSDEFGEASIADGINAAYRAFSRQRAERTLTSSTSNTCLPPKPRR